MNQPQGYRYYGALGITVCKQWRESFPEFLRDMGEIPEGLTLDRKNGLGNYEPGNCRWATRKEQQNNLKSNVRCEISGQTKTISEWAPHFGIVCAHTARNRIRKGWKPIDALTTPSRNRFTNPARHPETFMGRLEDIWNRVDPNPT